MVSSKQERIENIVINVDSQKFAVLYYIKAIANTFPDQKGQELADKFIVSNIV